MALAESWRGGKGPAGQSFAVVPSGHKAPSSIGLRGPFLRNDCITRPPNQAEFQACMPRHLGKKKAFEFLAADSRTYQRYLLNIFVKQIYLTLSSSAT
jgi:hypothetical protein